MKDSAETVRYWPHILLLWLMGLLAAAQLGKMSALLPLLREDLGISLVAAGWLASLLEAGGAGLGLAAGLLIGRLGNRSGLGFGLLLLAGAGLAEALAQDLAALVVLRLVEAAGYVLIVIAAPSMIAVIAPPSARGPAFALWSTFVPAGLALGVAATGSALAWMTRGEIFLGWGLLVAAVAAGWFGLPRGQRPPTVRLALPGLRVWLLTAGFGCFTVGEVGMLAMLPTFLIEEMGLASGAAGALAGAASLATMVGSFAAGWALIRRSGRNSVLLLSAIGLLAAAAFTLPIFLAPGLSFGLPPVLLAGVGAVAANAFVGLYPAVVFARLPDLVSGPAGIASANGVITQFGAGGALIGPPLAGFVAASFGWGTVSPVLAGCFIAAFALTLWAEARNS
ncbi:MFS transporter [Nisaea acidiphila]|uniref:MFS transporter n=1 Tax=Nisaea acidiphila TaxID=1862145 RepID=A0A9J7ARG0_9PROT|nr:MFS transporter [Nisaea acidiphila]UUX48932.1 MFS transporter [Nisaea acidiphila]